MIAIARPAVDPRSFNQSLDGTPAVGSPKIPSSSSAASPCPSPAGRCAAGGRYVRRG